MHVALPIDQTNRVEVLFTKPSLKIKRLEQLDSLMCSSRSPVLIIDKAFLSDAMLIRGQRNSKYSVIASIDLEGKTYGGNKIYQIQNVIGADGFEIGLTTNRNVIELVNEIKAIFSFLSQANSEYKIRLSVNVSAGSEHVKNCMEAIAKSKCNYEMISFLTDKMEPDLAHDIVKACRESIGNIKCKMKISGKPVEGFIRFDNNLKYQVNADDLM